MPDVRTQFTFYDSFFRSVSRIRKAADRASAYDAICSYALYGTEPDMDKLPDAAAIAFEVARPNLDASRRKAKSGKAGGMAKQTGANGKQIEAKPKQVKEQEKEQEQEQEQEQDKEQDKEQMLPPTPLPAVPAGKGGRAKRFAPPTRVELDEFIAENGLNVDADAFLDYYTANGWRVGSNSMKDWKATARNWSRRESARHDGGKKVPAGGAGQSPLGDLEQEAVRRMLGKE